MKMTKRITVLVSCLVAIALILTACGAGSPIPPDTKAPADTKAASDQKEEAKSGEKLSMVGLASSPDWKWADQYLKKVEEHFPEYSFVIKSFDASNIDKTLKTMVAAGNPPDFSFYWPNYISTYVQGNMALDLTPYLTENNNEWANTFEEGTLDIGKVDGKYYALPFRSVYPMLIVNKDITEKAGVTIPENDWTWEQFMEVNKTLKEKLGGSGVYPFAIRYDWACWLVRNSYMSNWDTKQQSDDFAAGKVSFLEPNVVKAFDAARSVYDNNYAYPGKGAIAVKVDEIMSAFKAGKIAMIADVNSMAGADIKNIGLKNIQIASWPHLGAQDILIGGCDGWFIPANAKHKEDSVKILKFLTGKEALQIVADDGSPVTVKGVSSTDPNFAMYSRDTAKITRNEIVTISSQIQDVITNKMPADYINKGKASLDALETMRKQAMEGKK